jgi:hypothetical protein
MVLLFNFEKGKIPMPTIPVNLPGEESWYPGQEVSRKA